MYIQVFIGTKIFAFWNGSVRVYFDEKAKTLDIQGSDGTFTFKGVSRSLNDTLTYKAVSYVKHRI